MVWDLIFVLAAAPVVVSYFGYLVLLEVLRQVDRALGRVPVSYPPLRNEDLPSVSLLVAAHNEEAVIEEKLRNFFELEYPPDRRRLFLVSDCSTDRTCELANRYLETLPQAERARVSVYDRRNRTGKTIALSQTIPETEGEILLFTDANSMYRPDAVRRLMQRFADPMVGLVCGHLDYIGADRTAGTGEALYWRYENAIKRRSGELGRLLVANGSIYAFRREIFEPLPGPVADDFVMPLFAASRGYRTVYEPEAIAEEHLAERFSEDFRAKARIISQGWEAVRRYWPRIFEVGWLRVAQYLVHKILRWIAPFLLVMMFVSSAMGSSPFLTLMFRVQVVFYAAALLGMLLRNVSGIPAVLRIPFYFVLVNVAAAKGFIDFLRGNARATWDKSESTRQVPFVGLRPAVVERIDPTAHDAIVMTLSATGLAVARSLAPKGVACWGIDSNRTEIGHHSRWIRHDPRFSYLAPGSELLDRLLEFGKSRPNPPVLYTAGDGYIDFVADHHEVLRKHFLLPDSARPEVSSVVMNKQTFYERCNEFGIPMARTEFPRSREDAEQAADRLRYPAIVKPAHGHLFRRHLRGEKLVEVHDRDELLRWWQQFDDWNGVTVLQEVIPGPETNIFVGALYADAGGVIRSLFTARKYRQYPPRYGSGSYMEACWSDEIAKLSTELVERLGYAGICGTEYKWDPRDEEWKLIEMNPRPTLWFSLPLAAGVDVIWDAHCDLVGAPNEPHIDCQDDRVSWQLPVRDLLSSVYFLRQGDLGWIEFVRTAINPWRKKCGDIELRDPKMFYAAIADAISKYRTHIRKK
jgi:predicted ATP-grasp superfamily ATP-dependent carboligase/cellulose synthase/poly-beta-1,6-N-acetylglucosamine synthase-like glycosyltransferase